MGMNPATMTPRNTAAWTPASLSSLVAWMDAGYGTYSDAGTTPCNLTDPVYRWVSRNNPSIYAEQSTLGARPTWEVGANGKNSVSSAGTRKLTFPMATGFPTGSNARQVSVMLNKTTTSNPQYAYGLGTATDNKAYCIDMDGPMRVVAYNNDITTNGINSSTNSWDIYDTAYSGTSLSHRKNAGTPFTATVTAFNTTYTSSIGGHLFAFVNGSLYMTGAISQWVLTNAVLSSGDQALLYAFMLTNKPT